MVNFSFAANKKLLFGSGKSQELPSFLETMDGTILFLTGNSVKETSCFENLAEILKSRNTPIRFITITGEPSPEVINSITEEYKGEEISGIVALGGGSVLDAGKAVSAMLCEEGSIEQYLEGIGTKAPSGNKLPFIALPTTAGTGSECTKNAVISRPGPSGFKKSLRHDNYIPDIAIIDPDWTESLPPQIGASCGMDAFSQLLESYISKSSSPLTDCLAKEGLERFFRSFSPVLDGQATAQNREDISLAAAFSGLTLANAGLGTVHGIAGTLGGLHPIPHGSACGLLMPSVMRLTFAALLEKDPGHPALQKTAELGRILKKQSSLSMEDAILALISQLDLWAEQAALPGLKEYGILWEDLKKAASLSGNKNNPYTFSETERFDILKNSF